MTLYASSCTARRSAHLVCGTCFAVIAGHLAVQMSMALRFLFSCTQVCENKKGHWCSVRHVAVRKTIVWEIRNAYQGMSTIYPFKAYGYRLPVQCWVCDMRVHDVSSSELLYLLFSPSSSVRWINAASWRKEAFPAVSLGSKFAEPC